MPIERWQQDIKSWVWEQGTARDLCGVDECKLREFTVATFPELTEAPADFRKDVKQDKQMNYAWSLAAISGIFRKADSIR